MYTRVARYASSAGSVCALRSRRVAPGGLAAARIGAALLLLPLAVSITQAQDREHAHAAPTDEQIGAVEFPISCGAEAQPRFEEGLALLHSFWYGEAMRVFEELAEEQPGCAMAHWGVAMSHWNPLWQPPSAAALARGRQAVADGRAAGDAMPRERAYVEAVGAFYDDSETVDHRTRALAFQEEMAALSERFPADDEAAIFHALALNATALPSDKRYANQLKALAILEPVFAERPNHPGVTHYLIHSSDYPPLAQRGLAAARRYAQVAPAVPHALHMPSHVFTRVGYWQDAIDSDLASAAAAREHGSGWEQLHALDYLTYAYLQTGRDSAAAEAVREAAGISLGQPESFGGAYALAAIPARYALERRSWNEAAALSPRETRFGYAAAITHFARAVGAARGGDAVAANEALTRLESLRDELTAAGEVYWAEQVEIQHLAAAGWLAHAEGRTDEALSLMRAAADLEDSTEKHPVTPGPVLPAREMLGDLLIELDRPAEARSAYLSTLEVSPNRFNAVFGAAHAAELAGDRAAAMAGYGALLRLAETAHAARRELGYAAGYMKND